MKRERHPLGVFLPIGGMLIFWLVVGTFMLVFCDGNIANVPK